MTGNKQAVRGVALISAMVVVAVVSASAAQLLYRQSIDVERSTRIMSREQAFLLAFGLETYARHLLTKDDQRYDYRFRYASYEEGDPRIEEWSWPIPNRDMPDEWLEVFQRIKPTLEARLDDLSSLFNLNGVYYAALLSKPDGEKPDKWETMYEGVFKRLFPPPAPEDQADEQVTEDLWNALLDWFDRDDEARDGGAEDEEYLDRNVPYLTGQTRMAWPEELRLVKGFNGKVADRLLPRASALPHPAPVRMNVNTIERNLLRHVLSSMPGFEDGIADEIVTEILSRRADDVYFTERERLKKFLNGYKGYVDDRNLREQNKVADFFDVKSNFFLFSACVRFGVRERPIEMQSLLRRENKRVVVLQRRMGTGYYKGEQCGRASRRAGSAPGDTRLAGRP